jgi:hypothetical protein
MFKKKLIEPSESALLISIKNNIRLVPLYNFIWTGFMVLYILLKDLWLLLMAVLITIFIAYHLLCQKIDKARLELLRFKDEMILSKGEKNV